VAVIAALNYPLTILLADDLTDVVTPDDDCSDSRTTCIRPIVSPRSRKIIGWSGIVADLRAHIPAAPRSWSAGVVLMTPFGMVMVVVLVIMMVAIVVMMVVT
jgi:hypothetical protein